MKRRLACIMAAMLMLLGMTAVPSLGSAEIGMASVIGAARVGTGVLGIDGKPGKDDRIPPSGVCVPDTSRGLRAPVNLGPGIRPEIPTGVAGHYQFTGTLGIASGSTSSRYVGITAMEADICGVVDSATFGLGAACGLSTGNSGSGRVVADNGWAYDITDVSWSASTGLRRHVTGTIRAARDGKGGAAPPEGTFSAIVAMLPSRPLDCASEHGATSYVVGGALVAGSIHFLSRSGPEIG